MTKSENSNMGEQLDKLIEKLKKMYEKEENKSEFLTEFKYYLYEIIEEKKVTKVFDDPKNTLATTLDSASTIKDLLNEIKKEYKACNNKKQFIKSVNEMTKDIKEEQDNA